MRVYRVATLLGLVAAIGWMAPGCAGAGYSGTSDDGKNGSDVPVKSVLFEEDLDSGAIHLQTNDADRLGPKGKTIWHMGTATEVPLTTVEARVYKLSGVPSMGYGISFAMQDIDNFLTVMITTTGYYMIGRVDDRVFTELTEDNQWQYSPYLVQGYNRPNRIRVTYDGGAGAFTLYINGNEQQSFVDGGSPAFTGGGFGHLVTLSPHEAFPETPVHAVFEPVSPSDIGVVPSLGGSSLSPARRGSSTTIFGGGK